MTTTSHHDLTDAEYDVFAHAHDTAVLAQQPERPVTLAMWTRHEEAVSSQFIEWFIRHRLLGEPIDQIAATDRELERDVRGGVASIEHRLNQADPLFEAPAALKYTIHLHIADAAGRERGAFCVLSPSGLFCEHPADIERLCAQVDPALYALRDSLGPDTPDGKAAGAIHDMVSDAIVEAYDAGVEFGAAAETLRRSMLLPTAQQGNQP